jgi:hypothetical protein
LKNNQKNAPKSKQKRPLIKEFLIIGAKYRDISLLHSVMPARASTAVATLIHREIRTEKQEIEEKFTMPKGGARVGSGRKRKPLAERMENNAGRRPLKCIPNEQMTEITAEEIPEASEWLKDETKNTQRASVARAVYEKTMKWVRERKCDHLITQDQAEQYAAAVARYIQCEEGISTFGLLAKSPKSGEPIASPYVDMSEVFLKRTTNLWSRIYQVVKDNCETPVGRNHNEDIMEQILNCKI